MNVKHRCRGTKYNGSLTVKKHTLRWDTKNVAKNQQQIRSRTYKRINNAHTYDINLNGMSGGGKTKEEKASNESAKKAKKEAADKAKKEAKERAAEAKKVLAEEEANQKQAKKEEAEKNKRDKKDKTEPAKLRAEQDKEATEAKNKPKKDEKSNANETAGKPEGLANNPDTTIQTKIQIEGVTKGDVSNKDMPAQNPKVLKLAPTDGEQLGETDTDADTKPAAAANTGAKVEDKKENKPGRMARWGQTLKKGASNALKATKKFMVGDENTSKLGATGKLLSSPFRLVGNTIYQAGRYTRKGYVGSKDWIGLKVTKIGIPESLRLVKKFNTWKTTRKAATGELKKQKYENKMQTKKDEISGYSQQIMLLEAKGEDNLSDDEKQQLNKLKSKMESAENNLDLIAIKNARWQTRSAKSKLELNKLQETRILPSTKQAIDNKIKQKQSDLDKHFEKADLDIKKNVASRVANLDTDTNFKAELASEQSKLDTELANKLQTGNLNEKQKQFIETDYARKKAALAQKLKTQKEAEFTAAETKKLAVVKKAAQTQIYNTQITKVAEKLGINIDAENPQLKALLEQHHADPNAKPLTGEELIKKVSDVGFTNIVANKQTMTQASKYLSAPHAMFKPGDKEAAIATLGNNSAKQSFYKEYVRDAKQKLDAKLTELPKGANNAKTKVELTRLKAQLDVMNKDKRFTGVDQDLYLYNLLKSKEEQLGISTAKKVKEASNAKLAIQDNGKKAAATDAYYNARTKNLDNKGLEQLAAIYNPDLKTYLSSKKIRASEQDELVKVGLQKYKDHIADLLQKNPFALKIENPTIYNQIFNTQNSIPSTALPTNKGVPSAPTTFPQPALVPNANPQPNTTTTTVKSTNPAATVTINNTASTSQPSVQQQIGGENDEKLAKEKIRADRLAKITQMRAAQKAAQGSKA